MRLDGGSSEGGRIDGSDAPVRRCATRCTATENPSRVRQLLLSRSARSLENQHESLPGSDGFEHIPDLGEVVWR